MKLTNNPVASRILILFTAVIVGVMGTLPSPAHDYTTVYG